MKWECSRFEDSDLPGIGVFFKKQFQGIGDYGSMALFHWKIKQNYTKQGLINIVKDGNTIASTTSVTPKKLIFKGEEMIAAEIGDTYTDSSYQRQGLFSLLINQSRSDANEHGIEFVYGTPNNQSLPGYEKKANFKIIPNLEVVSMGLFSNIQAGLQRKIHWSLAGVLGIFFNIAVYAKMKLFSLLNSSKNIQVEKLSELPEDWNDFWEQARGPFDFIFDRSREALQWRYFDSPNKYDFYRVGIDGKTVGFVVYRWIFDETENHLVIADYLFLPGKESLLLPTLYKTLKKVWKTHFFKVKLWVVRESPYMAQLKKFGFKESGGKVPVICHQTESIRRFDKCKSWHFSISDSDNI